MREDEKKGSFLVVGESISAKEMIERFDASEGEERRKAVAALRIAEDKLDRIAGFLESIEDRHAVVDQIFGIDRAIKTISIVRRYLLRQGTMREHWNDDLENDYGML
jgi:hypothetical protein